jgi:hypothetical protein
MEALIIGPEEIKRLLAVKKHAEENPFPLAKVILAAKSGEWNVVEPNFGCVIPIGFKVVLTVEEQLEPTGYTWHLSVSRPFPKTPSPRAVGTIIKVLDLRATIEDNLKIWFEEKASDCNGQETTAVNIVLKKEKV